MIDATLKPDRFDGAVDHYIAARLPYAPDLITWLVRETGADGKRVLDLGCGPGLIANAIAPVASSVIGLDPSPNMIAAAKACAERNVHFEIGSSEDLGTVTAPLQLVTIGRAFHWMDREQTLADLDPLIALDGAIALLTNSPLEIPVNRWWRDYNAVTKDFAVLDDFNRHRQSEAWIPHEQVLAASTFCDLRSIAVIRHHEWTLEKLVRNALSRSATTEAVLGDRACQMEAAIADALTPHGPGPWTSLTRHTALMARRMLV